MGASINSMASAVVVAASFIFLAFPTTSHGAPSQQCLKDCTHVRDTAQTACQSNSRTVGPQGAAFTDAPTYNDACILLAQTKTGGPNTGCFTKRGRKPGCKG